MVIQSCKNTKVMYIIDIVSKNIVWKGWRGLTRTLIFRTPYFKDVWCSLRSHWCVRTKWGKSLPIIWYPTHFPISYKYLFLFSIVFIFNYTKYVPTLLLLYYKYNSPVYTKLCFSVKNALSWTYFKIYIFKQIQTYCSLLSQEREKTKIQKIKKSKRTFHIEHSI